MGHEVVGEHRQPIEVVEVGDAGALQIGGGDLCALEERDPAPVVVRDVGEATPRRQRLNQPHRRSVSAVDDSGKRPPVQPLHVLPEVLQRRHHQPDQLVLRLLIDPPRQLSLGRDLSAAPPSTGPPSSNRRLIPAAIVR